MQFMHPHCTLSLFSMTSLKVIIDLFVRIASLLESFQQHLDGIFYKEKNIKGGP